MTECTKTRDEQDPDNPYKPFPKRRYFPYILEVIDNEELTFLYKSRTMMATWIACGWASHHAFVNEARTIVFQSKDEDRAIHCIDCCKELWNNSIGPLKARWKLKKDIEKQPEHKLELANRSKLIAIPGKDPDKVRSEHPTAVILDEAAFIEAGEESFSTAIATRCPKMIVVSSAKAGWLDEIYRSSTPAPWPKYSELT